MIISSRNSIVFIVLLFSMAAGALLPGAMALWELIDYHVNGKAAVMIPANPTKKIIVSNGGWDIHGVDVRYVSPDGELVVPGKLLDRATVKRLSAGERVPVTYLKSNPRHIYFPFEEPPNPWGWLTAGLLLLATSVYAVKLRRKERESHV